MTAPPLYGGWMARTGFDLTLTRALLGNDEVMADLAPLDLLRDKQEPLY
jgi:hypothetical protein